MTSSICLNKDDFYISCHASSICELNNGEFMVCCFAGNQEQEGHRDQIILGSKTTSGKMEWGEEQILVNVSGHAAGNPRIFKSPDLQEIWLVSPITYGEWCSGGTLLFIKRSSDNGSTWTDLEMIHENKGLLGKNKPLIENGICVLPVEQEETWSAKFLISENRGDSWEVYGDLGKDAGARIIQPTIVKLSDGKLMAYMRSQENYIFVSYSEDSGKTWSCSIPTALPNNNSGIDMVRLESGNLILVLNPTEIDTKPERKDPGLPDQLPTGFSSWGSRTPLVAALSINEGKTWDFIIALEEAEGNYSYPSIIQASDGYIHITYTYNRKKIKHVKISEQEILSSTSCKDYYWSNT